MKRILLALTVSLVMPSILLSCTKAPDTSKAETQTKTADVSKAGTGDTTSGATTTATAADSTPASTASGTDAASTDAASGDASKDAKNTAKATAAAGSDAVTIADADVKTGKVNPIAASQKAPGKVPGQMSVGIDKLPTSMRICTVSGSPITVGDYLAYYKLKQIELNEAINTDANMRKNLLAQAQKVGLKLNPGEAQKMIDLAKSNRSKSEDFKAFLKAKGITEAQFDKEISDIALAMKMGNVLLQQNLLNDLINRELLVVAGKASGLETQAMNRYLVAKRAPTYDAVLKLTGLTGQQMKNELVNTELSMLMAEKLASKSKGNDAQAKQFYDKNKNLFKHPERIRMSQILVAAPNQDMGNIKSVRSQIAKAKPKATKEELDKMTQQADYQLRMRAQEVLVKATAGDDFASLANVYTDDMKAKAGKTGGDLGYRDHSQIEPEIVKAIWPLKAGSVYPGLVHSNLGYHILKVTGRQPAGYVSFAEAKPALNQLIARQQAQKVVNDWLQKKRLLVNIDFSPEFAQAIQSGQKTAGTNKPAG
jgi:parvulin-like peptidyl-prolyl isomerase